MNVIKFDNKESSPAYYGVKTTGIFCRMGCPSHPPLKENTVFFDMPEQALAAGFRPCKRCRPDLPDYQPGAELAAQVKMVLDEGGGLSCSWPAALNDLGISRRRIDQLFREHYGVTPSKYADSLKSDAAKRLLADGIPVLDVALRLGFESISAFYAFFHKHTKTSPGECRRGKAVAADTHFGVYSTAIGPIRIASDGEAVISVNYEPEAGPDASGTPDALTDEASQQLEEYFAGERRQFTVPLRPHGTAFQQSVWQALLTIPYGQTRSYGQIAAQVGNPNASRAVGMANNKNPLMIFVPCHRVVGADGSLVGYAAGLEVKQRLLDLEKQYAGIESV